MGMAGLPRSIPFSAEGMAAWAKRLAGREKYSERTKRLSRGHYNPRLFPGQPAKGEGKSETIRIGYDPEKLLPWKMGSESGKSNFWQICEKASEKLRFVDWKGLPDPDLFLTFSALFAGQNPHLWSHLLKIDSGNGAPISEMKPGIGSDILSKLPPKRAKPSRTRLIRVTASFLFTELVEQMAHPKKDAARARFFSRLMGGPKPKDQSEFMKASKRHFAIMQVCEVPHGGHIDHSIKLYAAKHHAEFMHRFFHWDFPRKPRRKLALKAGTYRSKPLSVIEAPHLVQNECQVLG
jgi:hypothetical protein